MSADAQLILSGASIALSLAVIIVVNRDPGVDRVLRGSVMALALASAAHALLGAPAVRAAPIWMVTPLWMASASGVVVLWSVARLMFDARYTPQQAIRAPAALVAVGVVFPLLIAAVVPAARPTVLWIVKLVALGLVGHALAVLFAARRGSVDSRRWRLRTLAAGACSTLVLAALLAHASGWHLAGPLPVVTVLAAAQVTLKLSWLMLRVGGPGELVWAHARGSSRTVIEGPQSSSDGRRVGIADESSDRSNGSGVGRAVAARHAKRILDAMERERLYTQHGFGIGDLAAHLNLPEHRVRAIINGHLGFKNYAAFLNCYRLREAARRLRGSADAHLPVLTIALESGFGSIGPFNRAFREAFGLTPTAYRRGGPGDPAEGSH